MLKDAEVTLFATPLGTCAIAWADAGIVGVELPADDRSVRARLQRRMPAAIEASPTPAIQHAIDGVVALLEGEPRDLTDVEVDMSIVQPFDRRVLEAARTIPPGETLTYGQLAARIGHPTAAREVGAALGRNPFPIIVPCHRILAANGKSGGFSGTGGVATKLKLLGIERSPGPLFDAVDRDGL
jgi:methylated-DNA-[protein]-cysteine S-methyltransferase